MKYEGFDLITNYSGRWIICYRGDLFYSAHFATSQEARRYIDHRLRTDAGRSVDCGGPK